MRPSSTRTLHAPASRAYAFLIAAVLLLALPAAVSADAPPGPYFNGFETDTAGWFTSTGGTITRVPSGSPSAYANERNCKLHDHAGWIFGSGSSDWRTDPPTQTPV